MDLTLSPLPAGRAAGRRALLCVLPWLVAACSLTPGDEALRLAFDDTAHAFRAERAWPDGLRQTLYLSADELADGDTLTVRSLLTNDGDAPVKATWRICGLTLRAELQFEQPFVLCAAYSATGPIAPGDTVVTEDARVVHGPPDTYPLTAQHLLDPPRSLTVEVRIRP